MRIGLIGGSTNIKNQQFKAKDLYGFDNHFNSLFDYAQHVLKCDKIFILSPLHGLVSPHDVLPPKEKSISEFEDIQRYDWSCKILEQLKTKTNCQNDEFFILCNARFYEYFIVELKKTTIPFAYMSDSEISDKISKELSIVNFTNQDKEFNQKTLEKVEEDILPVIKKPNKESNIDIFGYVGKSNISFKNDKPKENKKEIPTDKPSATVNSTNASIIYLVQQIVNLFENKTIAEQESLKSQGKNFYLPEYLRKMKVISDEQFLFLNNLWKARNNICHPKDSMYSILLFEGRENLNDFEIKCYEEVYQKIKMFADSLS